MRNLQDEQKPMSGKICLVTGATSGIGAATTVSLARQGATVIGVGRNPEKCSAIAESIKRATGNFSVRYMLADLSVQNEIHELVSQFKTEHQRLDVLINNAGARFSSRRVSADGYEMTLALNHLSHFLLTNLLLDPLMKSGDARVVNVASGSHWSCRGIDFDDLQAERRYSGKKAYAQSKLATLLFTYELHRLVKGTGVTVNAADPGNVVTGFCRNNGLLSWVRHMLGSAVHGNLVGPTQGARTSIYLASSPEVDGVSGEYFCDLKPARSSGLSYDAAAASHLWEISLELTKLKTS